MLVSPAIPNWIPATVSFILPQLEQGNPHAGAKKGPDPSAKVQLGCAISAKYAVRETSNQHLQQWKVVFNVMGSLLDSVQSDWIGC